MVKPGYKKTEVGVIPEDWECRDLGSLADMKSGASITAASISEEALFPCYGGNGLRGYTNTSTHRGEFPLIGRQGAHCGNIQFATGEFFASEHAVVVSAKPKITPAWLNYVLRTKDLNRLSESSAQPGLSVTKLKPVPYPVPLDPEEQKAIAEALSDVDGLIEGLEVLIAKKRVLKTATMQQLLTGKTRLPGFGEGVGMKQTELGEIPEDWDVSRIDEACRLINGRGFKPHEWRENGLPIIRIQNLNGSSDFNYYQGHYDPKIEVENGQLLFAWSGSRGTSFGPHVWGGELGLLNYHTWKVVTKVGRVDPGFFYLALRELTRSIEDKAHGASALVHTQKWEMEGYEFPHPPSKDEQKAIAVVLADGDQELNFLEQRLEKAKALKQGMMQELLTGRTRLI